MRPDLVLMDIGMPGLSSFEATRQIKKNRPETKVLMLTMYDDEDYLVEGMEVGANGYVLKTADADDLSRAVRDVHDGKSVLDPAIARKLMTQLAGQADTRPIESLTPRELDVLKLAARGYTNKAIGAQLSVSDRTVQGHLANIFGKLHVATRTEAVMRAVQLGWITADETT